ncbi:MAG TPA: hypothetical protein H9896_05775 [Candidatus Pygmaiobacter gallistercoris]|nr:hypothetical protein [Candidatus Pygmaiobacter gallistercoris]
MAFPVSYSKTPLVLDAVSALKITHFYGHSALDEVYSYLRIFVQDGALVFSLTSFEQHPPENSRVGAAFSFDPEGRRQLFVSANHDLSLCAEIRTDGTAAQPITFDTPPALFGGSDEQGFYWGCRFLLGPALIKQLGGKLLPGSVFLGNAYKFADGERAYGAAFPAPPSAVVGDRNGFGEFVVVPY